MLMEFNHDLVKEMERRSVKNALTSSKLTVVFFIKNPFGEALEKKYNAKKCESDVQQECCNLLKEDLLMAVFHHHNRSGQSKTKRYAIRELVELDSDRDTLCQSDPLKHRLK